GQHVELLFPMIFNLGVEIGYAHTAFKWENSARQNAGVIVAVISLRNESDKPKYIFTDEVKIRAKNINGYLADGPNIIAGRRRKPLSSLLPPMLFGSKPTYGEYLVLTPEEVRSLVQSYPESERYMRRFVGAEDFIKGTERYCLWIEHSEAEHARSIPEIERRLSLTAEKRKGSKKKATQKLAAVPYRFGEARYKPTDSIIVPSVSSERREYISIGYVGPDTVISNLAFAVYDAEPWVFAILTSRMHMVWTRAIAG